MEIKYGSIKYFTLLRLQDILKSQDFNSLDLLTYDKLVAEIEMKVAEINVKTKPNNP